MPCTIRQNTQVSSWFQEDAGILSICDCIIKEVIEVKTANLRLGNDKADYCVGSNRLICPFKLTGCTFLVMSRGDRATATGIISTSMRDNYDEYGVAEASIQIYPSALIH